MPTYRSLFALREFRVLFASRVVVMLSVTTSGLALATLTFEATGSAALTALAMFGGPLVSLVTSQLLTAGADLVRPRTALLCQVSVPTVCNALQVLPLPWPARFVLLAVPYVVNAAFSGTQWVLLREVVPSGSYVLARSAFNLVVGGMQVLGYGVGGLALVWLAPRELFVVAALAGVVSVVTLRLGLADRPARGRTGEEGVVRRTTRVNRALLGSQVTRPLYVAMLVPNGLVVGCEALFVPYGDAAGSGALGGSAAGWLLAAAAAGMMVGDLVVGRWVPAGLRDRLVGPLRLVLATPYLLLLLHPPLLVTLVVAAVASLGYAASLPLQERLFAHTAEDVHGQAMALYGNGLMVGQAVGALTAGLLAGVVAPATAMGLMALASLVVTVLNGPGLRRSAPGAAQEVSASASA